MLCLCVARRKVRQLPPEVQVIMTDMPLQRQVLVARLAQNAMMESPDEPKEWPRQIKQELDKELGRLWHVVLLLGQFWNFISHEPGYAFNFKIGRHIFLAWRTPAI